MAIRDERDRDLAKVLVRHSTAAKPGETVVIHAVGEDTLGLAEAIVEEVLRAGAAPYLQFIQPEIERKFLHGATKEICTARRKLELGIVRNADCYIDIRGSANIFEAADVPPRQNELVSRNLSNQVRDERVNKTRWVVLRYPNSSMAQLASQPREVFADYFYRVCTVDYGKMERALKPLADLMRKTNKVEITGKGTELSFSIRRIPVVPCFGTHNIPDGECFTAPVRESVEGTVAFNTPTVMNGMPFDNITLRFEKGRVVEASGADAGQTRQLHRILDQDKGARYVGEFSIAFNPHIETPMRDILFDEKIAGSFHMALGAAYGDADNGNRSGLHWDLVCIQRPEYGGGSIVFDGEEIRRDGLFVHKDLKGLNPDAFKPRKRRAATRKTRK